MGDCCGKLGNYQAEERKEDEKMKTDEDRAYELPS
jgi:hypothetical protein